MYYLILFLASLMWSFVPVMVKSASVIVDSNVITFCRFLFGSLLLGCFLLLKDKKIRMVWRNKWIWAGVIGKSCNYLFENIAIAIGFVYGYALIFPVQAIFLAFISVLFFKEEIYPEKITAVILCLTGVILISWKGMPLKELFGDGIIPTVLFIFAAIGSGIHFISQKKLIYQMDSANMNFSVFFLCSLITAVPASFSVHFPLNIKWLAVCSLVGLGIVTGVSFYIYSKALKRIPFLIAACISNSTVLFTLLWSWVFFQEIINAYMIAGAIIMLLGLVMISVPRGKLFGRGSAEALQQESD